MVKYSGMWHIYLTIFIPYPETTSSESILSLVDTFFFWMAALVLYDAQFFDIWLISGKLHVKESLW